MQNNDDINSNDKSNNTGRKRNGIRSIRRVETSQDIEPSSGEFSNDLNRKTNANQRQTVLKRFKNRFSRKGTRHSEGEGKMSSRSATKNNGRETFDEEDDFCDQHTYEVPLNLSAGTNQNSNSRFDDVANYERRNDLTQGHSERNSPRITNNEESYWSNDSASNGGVPNDDAMHFNGGLAREKHNRMKQSKAMTLPSRSRTQPLHSTGSLPFPANISSEDSSSEDSVEPLPSTDNLKKTSKNSRNYRARSLPSKFTLNYQFLKGLNDLCKCGWYWGPLSSKEAEVKLHGKPDGAFLVRDSNDNHYLLSLSFRSAQKTLHTRIEFCKGMFSFYAAPFISTGSYASVVELIDHCVETSKNRVFCYTKGRSVNGAAFPVRLTKPVSRFEHVCSLQHLCRFVIRQHFSLENIGELPLPGMMKRYLEKNHFDPKQPV